MTPRDLAFIEHSLGIALPSDSKRIATSGKLHDLGNANSALFDEPKAIVEANEEYRNGTAGAPKWPISYFFIGHDGKGSCYVIDVPTRPMSSC